MKAILKVKLHRYVAENNPDLLVALQSERKVTSWLDSKVLGIEGMIEGLRHEGKPNYIIEEVCFNALTKDLRPSKFYYIKNVLEEDFPNLFGTWLEKGILTYEIINLINYCKKEFESLGFSEATEDDRSIKYTIIGAISEYIEEK